MKLSFCSLASGSSGNCYVIRTENTALIVDAGISGKRIFDGLAALGINREDVQGILITHEHIDHVKSVNILTKKLENASVFASAGTWAQTGNIREKIAPLRCLETASQRTFTIGDIAVTPFSLSHDAAEPVGYSFCAGGQSISIVTDTGCITEEIHEVIKGSALLVIEANHDVQMLEFCRYPYNVKRRILGEFGHLSNEAAAAEICRICAETGEYREVLLAHLSKENNFPEMAYQTVKNLLEEHSLYIGKHLNLHIMMRDGMSPVFTLGE